ncbi:hypothetical protein P154DRAFT_308666 [Amniculicola lignicola CBS 123094]|uniref:Uncharacterized protein n=1 Tax=Amniculicola lignicola CBS 123094 TaxID=1392246 RepID=A0A6A5WBU5_9PLEO|nr:hypothetical protein P154DRAFT_308666 [Amniculicola lignicola CBS 123094]
MSVVVRITSSLFSASFLGAGMLPRTFRDRHVAMLPTSSYSSKALFFLGISDQYSPRLLTSCLPRFSTLLHVHFPNPSCIDPIHPSMHSSSKSTQDGIATPTPTHLITSILHASTHGRLPQASQK